MKTKRIVAMMLAMGMIVSALGACGNSSSDTNQNSSAKSDSTDASADNAGDGITSEINMDEDPYTVAIQVVILPGETMEDEQAIEDAINEITIPAINAAIDIQYVWISELANTTSMGIASNEKLDILHVGTVSPLSSMVGSEMLYDMNTDQLLQNRGPKLEELFGDLLKAGNVKGQQLAIPADVYNATAKGISYNKEMADQYGITLPEQGTLDDFEKAITQLHEANPDLMPWYVGGGTLNLLYWLQGYDGFGTECSYGAILDKSGTTIENMYASDMFKDYCVRMYNWRQKGLIARDATDTENGQTYFDNGQLFALPGNISESLKVQNQATSKYEQGYMEIVSPSISNSSVTEFMWGIAANSERPDKAMDMLNYIYSDARIANLLMYGIEGKNYTFADGSDSIVVTNGSLDSNFLRIGDTSQMYIQAPAGEDYIAKCDAFEKTATESVATFYTFDDSEFQTESSVIYSTILEYLPALQNGMCESEEATLATVDEFVSKLEAAGINDVIAANQAQLDEYIASEGN